MVDIVRIPTEDFAVKAALERAGPRRKTDWVQILCVIVAFVLVCGVLVQGSIGLYRSLMGVGLPPHLQAHIK